MGDTTNEPDSGEGSGDTAASVAELDEALWNPISTAVIARTHPRFDELVLDACSGDGASAIPTAELVGTGGLVDAVELAEPLVDLGRARVGERMPQLQWHVADVTAWEPSGYDLVQCVLGVASFPDLDEGVRHLVERAKPGGRVAIAVWARGALEPLPELLAAAALPDDEEAAGTPAPAPAPALEAIETPGTLAQWLHGLGLEQVRAEAVQRHLDLSPELAWRIVEGTGQGAAIADLDDDERDAVRERFLAAISEREVTTVDLTTLIAIGLRPVG